MDRKFPYGLGLVSFKNRKQTQFNWTALSRIWEYWNACISHLPRKRHNLFWHRVSCFFSITTICPLIFCRLSIRQPSRVIYFLSDTSGFETHTPNLIVHELLHVNQKPCILFMWWPALPSLVTDEATKLSFIARAQYWVNDLVQFLEGEECVGDSFPASKLQEWYAATLKILCSVDPRHYLFDPTVFLVRMLVHLRSTLLNVNRFDINGATKSKGPIFVPLCFVRSWKEELLPKLHGNQSVLSELMGD